ncbi:MAG TPA: hypothetical protein VI731_06980 [Bacteroidia bacterium]|nr:hypothetical protein [Bacteroidia bacterium]
MKIPNKMKTLAECVDMLHEANFNEDFIIREDKKLFAPTANKNFNPEEVQIVNFYRFEGISDPADNSILYAIESADGTKGMLTDAYGPYADDKVTEFIKQVEEIHKKTDKDVSISGELKT